MAPKRKPNKPVPKSRATPKVWKDWSKAPNVMKSPVYFQADETCAAYAITGVTEAILNIKSHAHEILSPNRLLKWYKQNGFESNGAPSLKRVYRYMRSTGLSLERDEDEKEDDGEGGFKNQKMATVLKQEAKKPAVYISDNYSPETFNEDQLHDIIESHHPVIGVIVPYPSFKDLKDEIYRGPLSHEKNNIPRNQHALQIVGEGKDEDGTEFWIVKNSWGSAWGKNGYGKIIKSSSSHTKSIFVDISHPTGVFLR